MVEGLIVQLDRHGDHRDAAGIEVGARMFLSRHTVDFHLRQIFRELDIHSRVELTGHVMEAAPRGAPAG